MASYPNNVQTKSANAKSRDNKKLAAPAIVVGSEIWGGMVYSWAPEHVIAPLVVVVHYGYIMAAGKGAGSGSLWVTQSPWLWIC